MTLNLGDNAVKRLYVGDNQVKRVYLGDNQVWSGAPEFTASNANAGPLVFNATSVAKTEIDIDPSTNIVFCLWRPASTGGQAAGLTCGGVPMVNTGIKFGTPYKFDLYKLENPPTGTVEINGWIYGFSWFGAYSTSHISVFAYSNVTSVDAILTKTGGPNTAISHNAGYNSEGTLVQVISTNGAHPTAANYTPRGLIGDGRIGADTADVYHKDMFIYDTPALNFNQTFTETLSSAVAWESLIIKLSGD